MQTEGPGNTPPPNTTLQLTLPSPEAYAFCFKLFFIITTTIEISSLYSGVLLFDFVILIL